MRTMLTLTLLCFATGATAAGPPPIPTVGSVTPMGQVVQNPVIDGRDGTYSAAYHGRSYWAFNDTAMAKPNLTGANFIDNSLAAATNLDASAGIALDRDQTDTSGVPVRFVPFTTAEANFQYTHDPAHCTAPAATCGENLALWPGPVVFEPKSDRVIVPFIRIIRGGPISGFQGDGAGLAMGQVRASGEFALTRPSPTLMWNKTEIGYTDQAFVIGNMYYAYGDRGVFVTTEVHLARVPLAQVLNKSAWTYYAGNGTWSPDPHASVPVFSGGDAGSSVFYNASLGEWMAIYTGNYTNTMYFRVGAAPEGPWSAATLLFNTTGGWQGNTDYAGRAHPEFSPDGGNTQYLTYVNTTGFLRQVMALTKVVFKK